MSVAKVVRYTTKPEHAEENERLIRKVFAELAETEPAGVRYAAFRLDDGVSFVHVAVLEGGVRPVPVGHRGALCPGPAGGRRYRDRQLPAARRVSGLRASDRRRCQVRITSSG